MRLILCLLLLLGIPCMARGASEEVRRALPATNSEGEEVQRPIPFSEQELRVIRNLGVLPTERLAELLVVYEKLDNEAMCSLLVRQILKRDPKHPEALRVNAELDPDEEVRPVGYLELLSRDLLAGKKVGDPDGIAVQANALLQDEQAAEAVQLLEALRRVNFPGQPFPYDEDLASAYQESGEYDKAAELYNSLLKNAATAPATKLEAQKSLAVIGVQKRIAAIREQAVTNPEEGVRLSEKLLRDEPQEPLVIAFRVECLNNAGRHAESIAFLQKLKSRSKVEAFPHQEALAFAYYGAKDFKRARQAFLEIKNGPYEQQMRTGAEEMLVTLSLDEKLERGNEALKQGDITAAKVILEQVEREFPKNADVFAFRCLVMAKSGQSQEALDMLLKLRNEAATQGRLFTELDTLADVYVERKEYVLAISAYEDIINNPKYEAAMRAEAVKDLEETQVQQQLASAYQAIEEGSIGRAKKIYEKVREMAPKHRDVELLGADIKLATGKPKEALVEYQRLKSQAGPDVPFSGQSGIAESHYRLGQWEMALDAYNEILERPGYGPEEKWSATWDRRGLLPYLNNQLSVETSVLNESEGTRYSQSLAYTSKWWHDWRLLLRARNDSLSLDGTQSFLRDNDVSLFEAEVGVQRRLPGGYFAEATVGGAEDVVLYGARFGKFPNSGVGWGSLAWSLGFAGNARADYGLPLQALNGREDRIEFLAEGYLHPRVRFDAEAHASWIKVDGDDLGFHYGLGATLEYIVQAETRTRPEIAIGYHGEYSRFKAESRLPKSVQSQIREDRKPEQVRRALPADQELRKALAANYGREIFDSLVDPETNRHGAQITISKRLDTSWNAYVQGSVFRDFDDRAWEYTLAAGLEYWMNDHTMFYLEMRYDSDGMGTGQDDGAWQATLGAEVTF